MNGREESWKNDLFFVCSLIEYAGRKSLNERKVVVNAMGREGLSHYMELADVYHSENLDKVTDELIARYRISTGTYDNVSKATDRIPTHWDIGKVMQRLILEVAGHSDHDVVNAMMNVYNSWIVYKIDDYNCSMYYENTSYQYASYQAGYPL